MRFVIDGYDELKAALRALPEELKGEATGIVMTHATKAKAAMAAEYAKHRHTGNLAAHLQMTVLAIGRFGAGVEIRNRAYHAWLFDNGTEARHYTGTDKRGRVYADADRGRMWGKSQPTHVFTRNMSVQRRAMFKAFAELLRTHGLLVSGGV